MTPRKGPFENTVGKGENAGNQHFLFPQCFLPYQRQKSSFELHLFCPMQMLSIWSHPKYCCLLKILTLLDNKISISKIKLQCLTLEEYQTLLELKKKPVTSTSFFQQCLKTPFFLTVV